MLMFSLLVNTFLLLDSYTYKSSFPASSRRSRRSPPLAAWSRSHCWCASLRPLPETSATALRPRRGPCHLGSRSPSPQDIKGLSLNSIRFNQKQIKIIHVNIFYIQGFKSIIIHITYVSNLFTDNSMYVNFACKTWVGLLEVHKTILVDWKIGHPPALVHFEATARGQDALVPGIRPCF